MINVADDYMYTQEQYQYRSRGGGVRVKSVGSPVGPGRAGRARRAARSARLNHPPDGPDSVRSLGPADRHFELWKEEP